MKKEHSILLRACIPLVVAIGGILYLRNMPAVSLYKPTEMKTSTYTLIDADSDGDVDAITPKGRPSFVAPDMVQYIKDNGDTFIDYMGRPAEIPPHIQESANKTLRGEQDPSQLEKELNDIDKSRR